MQIEVKINEQLNGIEIYFPENPGRAVVSKLQQVGFRYKHKPVKYWWAKYTEQRMAFARNLSAKEEGRE